MTIMLNKYIIKYKFNNNRVLINALIIMDLINLIEAIVEC